MKTSEIKDKPKKITILTAAIAFTVIMLCLAAGCTKENHPVRLVFPVVTTAPVSDSTSSTAVTGGNITSDGGFAISERGVCYSRLANPSLAKPDSVTKDGPGIGLFVSNISGLAADSTYHIRAYATNSEGTAYGKDISFKTKKAKSELFRSEHPDQRVTKI